ncbi:hypothetical protein NQ318_008027 [Aromia moschata]|uniref:DUF4817 domain-containing protein n=1 Tax=Aromia moschata TaxID=1265417 RepID=A0AAV8XBZ3_9CUCU|nr:hypothetical protein NQ318_008027 [Aromia moschata]
MIYGYGNRKSTQSEVCTVFNGIYPDTPVSQGTVCQLIKKFLETGNVKGVKRTGRPKSATNFTRQPALYVLGLWWGDLATRSNKRQLATGRCSGRITRSLRVVTVIRWKKKCNVRLSNGRRSSFCVKLEKSAAETIPMLKKAFGVDCLSEDVNDENRAGRPSTSSSDDNVKRVPDLLNTDRRLFVRLISETLDITKTIVHEIVSESLEMRKIDTTPLNSLREAHGRTKRNN